MPEPFRMLAHPRMVGRALDREIDRDLQPQASGRRYEVIEIVQRRQAQARSPYGRRLRCRSPTDCRDCQEAESACCWAPCDAYGRSDGWARGKRCRIPGRGSRAAGAPPPAASRHVPGRPLASAGTSRTRRRNAPMAGQPSPPVAADTRWRSNARPIAPSGRATADPRQSRPHRAARQARATARARRQSPFGPGLRRGARRTR